MASRISTGRSGLCCFMTGYFDAINCLPRIEQHHEGAGRWTCVGERRAHLVPADAAPDCEHNIRISLIAGEKALVKDMTWERGLGGATDARYEQEEQPNKAYISGCHNLRCQTRACRVVQVETEPTTFHDDHQHDQLPREPRWTTNNNNRMTGQIVARTDCPRSPKSSPEERDPPSIFLCSSPSNLIFF